MNAHSFLGLCTLVAVGTLAGTALAQTAGNYDLHWNVTAAGGGAMSGADGYTLTGSVGQPEANPSGASTGANGYALASGFWVGAARDTSDEIFKNGFE